MWLSVYCILLKSRACPLYQLLWSEQMRWRWTWLIWRIEFRWILLEWLGKKEEKLHVDCQSWAKILCLLSYSIIRIPPPSTDLPSSPDLFAATQKKWRETLSRKFYMGECSLGRGLVRFIKIWKLPIMKDFKTKPTHQPSIWLAWTSDIPYVTTWILCCLELPDNNDFLKSITCVFDEILMQCLHG